MTPTAFHRHAVILRHTDGRPELLSVLHETREEAEACGRFWHERFQGGAAVELVPLQIPAAGESIKYEPGMVTPAARERAATGNLFGGQQ